MTSEIQSHMKESDLKTLRAKLKHSKHHVRNLVSNDQFSNFYESEKVFKDTVNDFFDLDDNEMLALWLLGYPIRGALFFDHHLLTRTIQLIPEFLLSLLKLGNSTLFTIYEYQTEVIHEGVDFNYKNIRAISENVFYIWKQIGEIETSDQSEDEKLDQLQDLNSVLGFEKPCYDFLSCFQMNVVSQQFYLRLRGVQQGVEPGLVKFNDSDKRRLLEEIVGFLAMPLVFAEEDITEAPDIDSVLISLAKRLRETGFITNVHSALRRAIVYPSISESMQSTEQLQASQYVFQRIGDVWNIKYGVEYSQFKHIKGFDYIHKILSHFPNSVTPEVLSGIAINSQIEEGVILSQDEMDSIKEAEDRDSVHYASQDYTLASDKKQHNLMKAQVRVLMAELEDISPDDPKHGKLVEKINQLNKAISNYYNVHGEPRPQYEAKEKARSPVTKAIGRAKQEIAVSMPELHSHLKKHLKGGYEFYYSIKETEAPSWQL